MWQGHVDRSVFEVALAQTTLVSLVLGCITIINQSFHYKTTTFELQTFTAQTTLVYACVTRINQSFLYNITIFELQPFKSQTASENCNVVGVTALYFNNNA